MSRQRLSAGSRGDGGALWRGCLFEEDAVDEAAAGAGVGILGQAAGTLCRGARIVLKGPGMEHLGPGTEYLGPGMEFLGPRIVLKGPGIVVPRPGTSFPSGQMRRPTRPGMIPRPSPRVFGLAGLRSSPARYEPDAHARAHVTFDSSLACASGSHNTGPLLASFLPVCRLPIPVCRRSARSADRAQI